MQNGTLQIGKINQKQFLMYAYIFLCIAFVLMMVQNFIRYGSHDGYRPIRTLLYLINSLLLFIPLMPLFMRIARKYLLQIPRYYYPLGALLILAGIFFFYFYSSITLYLFGFYDEILSPSYARNYFGREALLHLIVLCAVLFYVWYKRTEETVELMISGSLGRKKVSLPASAIAWIASDDHYLKLHNSEMTLLKRSTMREMEELLAPNFVRIHRKYLVNTSEIVGHLKENRSEYLILRSGEKLKIGRSYLSVLESLNLHDV